MQKVADWLPANKTTLHLPGQKDAEIQLGNKETGWKDFSLPLIEVGSGTYLNPATIDLDTLNQLANDFKSPFCSEAFVNATAVVPATLTYSVFTLTLETGACAITTDFTPNPNNPYDDWLASKGFVCKTPELSFTQDPATFTESYTAPATLITSSCKVAKNTTDGWSRQLYSAGDPVTYASRADFVAAMMNGTQTDIWTPTGKSSLMDAIITPLKQYIKDAQASAPPLVVHVDTSSLKSGRRLKDIMERL
ncbi:g1375 [Coccomyxa elongata]